MKFAKKLSFLQSIFSDILNLYKNFWHFALSKVLISAVGFLLGVLATLPCVFLLALVMWGDPIAWREIFISLISEGTPDLTLLSSLLAHPFWIVFSVFLSLLAIFLFVIVSWYGNFLLAKVFLKYLSRKRLEYKKNLYFSRVHILSFVKIILWIFLFFLPLGLGFLFVVFLLSLFLDLWIFEADIYTILSYAVSWIFWCAALYLLYRLVFSYIILADTKKSAKVKPSLHYIRASLQATKGMKVFYFGIIALIYALCVSPFYGMNTLLEDKVSDFQDVYSYRQVISQNIEDLSDDERQYFSYLAAEYEELSDEQLLKKIGTITWIGLGYGIFLYFLLAGTFVFVLTSFYKRVLLKK
jgi:hypothetical protein